MCKSVNEKLEVTLNSVESILMETLSDDLLDQRYLAYPIFIARVNDLWAVDRDGYANFNKSG